MTVQWQKNRFYAFDLDLHSGVQRSETTSKNAIILHITNINMKHLITKCITSITIQVRKLDWIMCMNCDEVKICKSQKYL